MSAIARLIFFVAAGCGGLGRLLLRAHLGVLAHLLLPRSWFFPQPGEEETPP